MVKPQTQPLTATQISFQCPLPPPLFKILLLGCLQSTLHLSGSKVRKRFIHKFQCLIPSQYSPPYLPSTMCAFFFLVLQDVHFLSEFYLPYVQPLAACFTFPQAKGYEMWKLRLYESLFPLQSLFENPCDSFSPQPSGSSVRWLLSRFYSYDLGTTSLFESQSVTWNLSFIYPLLYFIICILSVGIIFFFY